MHVVLCTFVAIMQFVFNFKMHIFNMLRLFYFFTPVLVIKLEMHIVVCIVFVIIQFKMILVLYQTQKKTVLAWPYPEDCMRART